MSTNGVLLLLTLNFICDIPGTSPAWIIHWPRIPSAKSAIVFVLPETLEAKGASAQIIIADGR